ncbi:uncharacterized protein Z518_10519 [Rhinocladiella mackenziei CBS 650.93]|uniref:Protein PXR1 n=1 Tax=Rhinocladiella mackenziei CBS 650.93 TaxID=1442369 RepID=A0A0D2IUI3_9EURO|nr:uncharacterized protein Z518_10519 [Rhinocladiella mackenziei CBS 650.93]KIX00380.1 hypothetical protein Z518_10519 [Rhinocladiella mackenziei CBS 650.93]
MGLAEPRKRLKISHDPRNLSWSQSSSFGQRLMARHGWKEGQSLGNRDTVHIDLNDAERLAAARVGVLFKDDNLGLGATRKSTDVEGQRTGLDAFQGLLGRLNGKTDVELKKEEKKLEDRKLEMHVRGRWGGMVFVRGEVLVGDRNEEDKEETVDVEDTDARTKHLLQQNTIDKESKEKWRRTEETRERKEAKRLKGRENALRNAARQAKRETRNNSDDDDENRVDIPIEPLPVHKSPPSQPPDEPVSSSSSGSEAEKKDKDKIEKRKRSAEFELQMPVPSEKLITAMTMKNGRHVLRGRNIRAKRMAFADLKGLDEIFMK